MESWSVGYDGDGDVERHSGMHDARPEKQALEITLVSDYICPWCYVGLARLEQLRGEFEVTLSACAFDLRPGIIYFGQTDDWGWAAEVDGTIRLGENSNDYTLGDRLHLSAMGTRRLTDWMAPFVRLDGQVWGNIDGADPALNPNVVPTADPDRRAGARVDLTVGVNLYAGEGILKGHRLGIQGGLPIYQSLDGPQLETDWQVSIGWQWIFRL